MIDLRFAASALIAVIVPFAVARRAARRDGDVAYVMDVGFGALVVGLAAARVAAVALDDPAELRDLKSMLSIRGGVELWAGVFAGAVYVGVRAARSHHDVWRVLASGTPLAIWGYATWEATCLIRDGCFGPISAIGLVPTGLTQRVLPVGLLVAVAVAVIAGVAWHWRQRAPILAVFGSAASVAVVRAVAGFWLPALGDGLTRPHRESLVLALFGVVAFLALSIRRPASKPTSPFPTP